MPISEEHEIMIRRMGMTVGIDYEELRDHPTDMSDPKVVERMMHVINTTNDCPTTIDLLNDFDLGNLVRMLLRSDIYHEHAVEAARNRIWKLSKQLEILTLLLEHQPKDKTFEFLDKLVIERYQLVFAEQELREAAAAFKVQKRGKNAQRAIDAANSIKRHLAKKVEV